MTAAIRTERHDRVIRLVIDRPEARNAVTQKMMETLAAGLREAAASAAAVVVIQGAGDRAFCAGADLGEIHAGSEGGIGDQVLAMRRALDGIPQMPQLVITALNGDAYGGGAELAVAGDLRVMSSSARLRFVHTRLGLMPAWGGVERLTALVGRSRALDLLLTGRVITADQALTMGIVQHVLAAETFQAGLDEYVELVLESPPGTIAGIKRLAGSVIPHHHPELEAEAMRGFREAWDSEEHWRRAARLQEVRRTRGASPA